jgi:hypothetical protein
VFAKEKNMMNENEGIVDAERNPFGCPDLIKQGYSLTDGRKRELALLFGKTVQEIMSADDRSTSRYPAFVASIFLKSI